MTARESGKNSTLVDHSIQESASSEAEDRERCGYHHVPTMGNQLLAPTPPLGWNSWDSYGMCITEEQLLDNARAMQQKLLPFGFRYLVMDAGWFNPRPELASHTETPEVALDEYGRLVPTLNRFPSAANGVGLRAIAQRVHERGLKFGIHMMRGIPRAAVTRNTPILGSPFHARDIANESDRCAWNQEMFGVDPSKPGAQAYYDSVASLLAAWEIDFVKADDFAAPYHAAEIALFSGALRRTGRSILLSLSPGASSMDDSVAHAREFSEMRRTSKDLWDDWSHDDPDFACLKRQFSIARAWQGHGAPGHWPDLDMLPIGRLSLNGTRGPARESRFTEDERITLLSLWALFQSPLMLGGDLLTLGEPASRLLGNRELLEINQHGHGGRELSARGDEIVWRAELPEARVAIGAFNLSDEPRRVELPHALVPELVTSSLRDLWTQEDLGRTSTNLELTVPAHGARVLRLTPR